MIFFTSNARNAVITIQVKVLCYCFWDFLNFLVYCTLIETPKEFCNLVDSYTVNRFNRFAVGTKDGGGDRNGPSVFLCNIC